MTPEQFASYLQDESYLQQLSYPELQSLVIQYPFCQNFRMLLFKKSQLEQHPNVEKDLQKAAIYASDRRFLQATFKRLQKQELILQPETEVALELTSLAEVENWLEERQLKEFFVEIQPDANTEQTSLEAHFSEDISTSVIEDFSFDIPSLFEEETAVATELAPHTTQDYMRSLFELTEEDNLFQNLRAFEQGIPFGEEAEKLDALWQPIERDLEPTLDTTAFKLAPPIPAEQAANSYMILENISEEDAIEAAITQFKTIASNPVNEASLPLFKAHSSKNILSEMDADALVLQGNIEEALQMYEVLRLENPDKNLFFAQKIKLLRQELNSLNSK